MSSEATSTNKGRYLTDNAKKESFNGGNMLGGGGYSKLS